MTKITERIVKCARCGEESKQTIVFNVNFSLGSKEYNEKLMAYQQKCPNCGYEASDISIDDKYEFTPENNIPQIVYGIPDFMKDQVKEKETKVFDGFHGGYFGPSYFYYIFKIDGSNDYTFKSAFSSSGKKIFEDSNELICIRKNEEQYLDFKNKLISFTSSWNKIYNNNDIMDGTQWHFEIVNEDTKSGSNEFPENYYEVLEFIDNEFGGTMKYSLEPEDNIPREVYGIMNPEQFDLPKNTNKDEVDDEK